MWWRSCIATVWPESNVADTIGGRRQTVPSKTSGLSALSRTPILFPPARRSPVVVLLRRSLILLALLIGLSLQASPVWAVSPDSLPEEPPSTHVLDSADLLSRATVTDVSHALQSMADQGVQATWVSIPRLDYGVSLGAFGETLLQRWSHDERSQLVLLLDGQTSATAIVATPVVQERLSPDLLRSTARTTMAQPLRDGGRYRQASLDAIQRLSVVLAGEPDPGEPTQDSSTVATARVPSREETQSSNAFTWVAVLLVVGTIVPMLTWWVFSR